MADRAERLLGAAKEWQPRLVERAPQLEEARHLPADLAAALAKAGFFRMMTPAEIGGLELSVAEIFNVLEALSYGDASVGWCAMIANTAALSAGYIPRDEAQAIYGPSEVITAGVFGPMGKAEDRGDHYEVSGQWQWGSGSANASWIAGGCMIFKEGVLQKMPDGAPMNRMMIMPREQIKLHDTWHSQGLKGTGSGDFSVEKVCVPKERSVSLAYDTPLEKGPLYQFPMFGLLALGVCAVAIGNARAALDESIAVLKLKKPAGAAKPLSEQQITQYEIAKLEASWRSARAFLVEAIAKNWAEASDGAQMTNMLKAELRLACTNGVQQSAHVCKQAYELGGGGSVFLSSSLQRRFRDAHVMTQHITCAPALYGLAGRILLGIETHSPVL